VNLLLVEAAEVTTEQTCVVDGRRALHLRSVIGVTVGQVVRAGVIGGGIGTAEVMSDDGAAITLRLAITADAPPPLPIELVIAVPRPKVLTRVIETAATFGVARIDLTNAWRVDKSYLSSPRLLPEALAYAVRFGAEQGVTTHLAPIAVHERLMGLLDERWPVPETIRRTTKLIAHPGAPPIEQATTTGPLTLAIGPEGGWIQREVDTFIERGFTPVSIGSQILRVETAIAAALGQLLLLRRLRAD
jgi:16S rRNA (uracil1498-N3)-methyltransferase